MWKFWTMPNPFKKCDEFVDNINFMFLYVKMKHSCQRLVEEQSFDSWEGGGGRFHFLQVVSTWRSKSLFLWFVLPTVYSCATKGQTQLICCFLNPLLYWWWKSHTEHLGKINKIYTSIKNKIMIIFLKIVTFSYNFGTIFLLCPMKYLKNKSIESGLIINTFKEKSLLSMVIFPPPYK